MRVCSQPPASLKVRCATWPPGEFPYLDAHVRSGVPMFECQAALAVRLHLAQFGVYSRCDDRCRMLLIIVRMLTVIRGVDGEKMVLDVCDSSDLTRTCDDDGATKRSQFHIMQFCFGVTVSSRACCVIRPHAIASVRAQGWPECGRFHSPLSWVPWRTDSGTSHAWTWTNIFHRTSSETGRRMQGRETCF